MQEKGVTVVLGEMDVARVNPHQSGQVAPQRSAAVTGFWGGGGHEVGFFPCGRRPPVPGNIGSRWMGITLGEDEKRERC